MGIGCAVSLELTPGQRLEKLVAWCETEAAKGNPEAILTLQHLPEVMAKVRANQEAGRTPKLRSVLPGPDN